MKRQLEESESFRQAKTWETVTRRYQREGLCRGCAGQAAYGHQLGFSRVNPPCGECAPIVDGFPCHAAGPWRRVLDPQFPSPRPHPGRVARTETP